MSQGRKRINVVRDYDGNDKLSVNEWGLAVDLYPHQKNSVKKMEYMEKNRRREYTNNNRTCTIESNFGILNDKVGSGKTLMCVSLISRDVNQSDFRKESYDKEFFDITRMSGNGTFSIIEKRTYEVKFYPITVIVVNNGLVYQWKGEMDRSNLLYKLIYRTTDITDLPHYINNVNVIIVSQTFYSRFRYEFEKVVNRVNYCIKRLIVDEYIMRGSFEIMTNDYCWLVTATFPRIAGFNRRELSINYINRCLEQSSERQDYHYYTWDRVVVRNSPEELENSFLIADVNNLIYVAEGNHNRLLDMNINVSAEVKRMIAADDIKTAIQSIGGNVETDSLLSVIIRREEEEIRRIEASITYYTTLSQEDKKQEHMQKLEIAKKNLQNLKEKIERDETTNECPLCYDEFRDKCLINCCKNIVCDRCIARVIQINNRCPFCRQIIIFSSIILSTENAGPSPKKMKIKTKGQHILDIVRNNPTGKFIIFAESSNTYNAVYSDLLLTGLKFAEIRGTSAHKNKTLERYKNGEINILFLNCRSDGSGLNLPETTDIILYHKISSQQLETQLLGRALRLGRTKNLTVHRILYKQEVNLRDDEAAINHLHDQQEEENFGEEMEANNNAERERQIQEDYELALQLQNSSA